MFNKKRGFPLTILKKMAAPLDPKRYDCVTASDVPAICGESGFRGANWSGVMRKKVFHVVSEETDATRWGKTNEPNAIRDVCLELQAVVDYPGFVIHPRYSWMGGTIDARLTFTYGYMFPDGTFLPPGTVAILEVKCPKSRPIQEGVIPGQYIGQLQTYLEIFDCEHGIFLDYKPAGPRSQKKMMILHIWRDRNYMGLRLPYLKKWWDEYNIYTAYVNAVVTCIQRAWRLYLARRAVDRAAKYKMAMRIGCASTVGKIAGFLRKKKIDETIPCVPECTNFGTIFVDFADAGYDNEHPFRSWMRRGRANKRTREEEYAPPLQTGVCYVSMDQ